MSSKVQNVAQMTPLRVHVVVKSVTSHPRRNTHLCNCNYLPRRRRPGTGDIATPPVRPSVRLSVRPSVRLSVRHV